LKCGRSDSEVTVSPRKRNTKQRSRSRDMRRENSVAVWNELARYKQDNKALAHERWVVQYTLWYIRRKTK